jgi:Tol biopolymer transport system component
VKSFVSGLIVAASVCFAAVPSRSDGELSPAEALNYERVGDFHFSPDGRTLAYVELSYPRDWMPRIRVLGIGSGAMREITPEKKSERAPEWSPDSKTLAFLSNRGGTTQVYALLTMGGEASPLTQQKSGVSAFHWSPNGRAIAFLAKEAEADPDAPKVADSESELERLWIVDLTTKATRQIGPRGYRIDEFRWQDASHILIAASPAPKIQEFNNAIYSIALKDRTIQTVAQPPQPFDSLLVSPDGTRLALRSTRAHGPIPHDLFVRSLTRSDLHDISASMDLAVLSAQWHEPSTIWTLTDDGFYRRLYRVPLSGAPARIELPLSVGAFDVSREVRAYRRCGSPCRVKRRRQDI